MAAKLRLKRENMNKKRILLISTLLCSALIVVSYLLSIQLKARRYQVVSIVPGSAARSGGWRDVPNGFQLRGEPLDQIVFRAYEIKLANQVSGMPEWADSIRYDVDAKVSEDTAEAWKNLPYTKRRELEQPMLRNLLASCCQFKAHEVTEERPIYELVIASDGAKLKEATSNENASYVGTILPGNGYLDSAKASSLESLANNLTWRVNRVVVNKTGLEHRKFDFELKWTPSVQDTGNNDTDTATSISTALEEQLGLKLIPARAAVKTLVIDRMEPPSLN
jgi:bla regulator protein BlaR1